MINIFSTEGFTPSWHCAGHSLFWGWATIILCLTVIVGYLNIAYHWYKNLLDLEKGLARSALIGMTNIFLFCGICGYFFTIVMMWYPVWQIRVLFLAILSFITWKYVLTSPHIKVIYQQIHTKEHLTKQLFDQTETATGLKNTTNQMVPHIEKLSDSVIFHVNDDTSIKTLVKIEEIRSEINRLEKILKEAESVIQNGKKHT